MSKHARHRANLRRQGKLTLRVRIRGTINRLINSKRRRETWVPW